MKVVVVGAGISGLTAAYELLRQHADDPNFELQIIEASDRAGGVISTSCEDGFVIEHGPDSFITTKPWAVDLCNQLGLGDQVIGTNEVDRRAFVAHDGHLVPLPEGFVLLAPSKVWPFIDSPLLSIGGKLTALWEACVSTQPPQTDVSLETYIVDRFGQQLYERIAQPMVAGIFTGDASKLSALATLPQFVEMHRKHGSIIRGLMQNGVRKESGARYGAFATLKNGMETLVNRLVSAIGEENIAFNCRLNEISRDAGGWLLNTLRLGSSLAEKIKADAVIFAVSARSFSKDDWANDQELALQLGRIESTSSAVLNMLFSRKSIGHPLDGFGFVVPERESRSIIACSFSSKKFPGRAAEGKCLLRVFLGGALHAADYQLSDSDLIRVAMKDLRAYLDVQAPAENVWISRWPESMPQYKVGHLDLVRSIQDRLSGHSGLFWCGSSLTGVGIPDCIKSGQTAAADTRGYLELSLPPLREAARV